jgi:orotate phosphoribosyltransferase
MILAQAVATALPSAPAVRDVLRWDSPIVSSRLLAGTRDVAALYRRLVVTGPVAGARVVLVDDVLTMGGHLRACAAKLREVGADVVLGVCAGRADRIPAADPFAVRCETLEDFIP